MCFFCKSSKQIIINAMWEKGVLELASHRNNTYLLILIAVAIKCSILSGILLQFQLYA
jgi:hypothetical protein